MIISASELLLRQAPGNRGCRYLWCVRRRDAAAGDEPAAIFFYQSPFLIEMRVGLINNVDVGFDEFNELGMIQLSIPLTYNDDVGRNKSGQHTGTYCSRKDRPTLPLERPDRFIITYAYKQDIAFGTAVLKVRGGEGRSNRW